MGPMITARGLCREFVNEKGRVEQVLTNIDLDVGAGEFLAILGPSGVGKTTLLKVLAGLQAPSSGQVEYHVSLSGDSVERYPPKEAIKRGIVSSLFQRPVLAPWRTVLGNVMLPMEIRATHKHGDNRARAIQLLLQVGLTEADAGKFPRELSGGMQQRLALAMLLSYNPQALFLDEPFGALDAVTRRQMQKLLLSIWDVDGQRKTIVLVTHDVYEAVFLADRVVVIPHKPVANASCLAVPIARPRDFDLLYDSRFKEISEHAFQIMSNGRPDSGALLSPSKAVIPTAEGVRLRDTGDGCDDRVAVSQQAWELDQ